MHPYYLHAQDDSNPQRPRRATPPAQGEGFVAGHVSLGLSAIGNTPHDRTPDTPGTQGAIAPSCIRKSCCFSSRGRQGGERRTLIVVDASVVLELLLGTPESPVIEKRVFETGVTLHAPHLLDLEVTQVLRRYYRFEEVSRKRGEQALTDLADFPIERYPHTVFLQRIWDLRNNLTAHDAAYVALAEALAAPLLTCDSKLANAGGHRALIELV